MNTSTKAFSLPFYILIVCLFSWPFQFAYAFLGDQFRPLLLISMIMVAVSTYVCGKFIFKDGFKQVGWKWGNPKYYLIGLGLGLLLWFVPVLIEHLSGTKKVLSPDSFISFIPVLLTNMVITLLPAFSEEFGWRGYLLPRLLKQHTQRKALLVHGFITWFWHIPVLVVMGLNMQGNPVITIPVIMLISLIPTVMHAIVFSWFWAASQSIAVATFYHAAFDEIRDSVATTFGHAPFSEVWQMALLTILGTILFIKTRWINKAKNKVD